MANRILVVDDNSDIRENICEYLNLRGHQTIGASDAASAAQLIAEEDIALIVLDVGLARGRRNELLPPASPRGVFDTDPDAHGARCC